MKTLAVAAIAIMAGIAPAAAFDASFRQEFERKPDAKWQESVPGRIRNVSSKVTDAMWVGSGSLWVDVRDDGTNWEKAGRFFCNTLAGAGKPDKGLIIITFWRDDEITAKVHC